VLVVGEVLFIGPL